MRCGVCIFNILYLLIIPFSVFGNSLLLAENKWASCDYYDNNTKKIIHEDCEGSKIQIASCSDDTCFFQANFNHGNPWNSECIMWGKLKLNSADKAYGTAIAEYRSRGMDNRKYEDCELEFSIHNGILQISIISGCDKYCTPKEFEFYNTYHIDNTGGAVTM